MSTEATIKPSSCRFGVRHSVRRTAGTKPRSAQQIRETQNAKRTPAPTLIFGLFFALALGLLALTGCSTEDAASNTSDTSNTSGVSHTTGRSVTDLYGRCVELPNQVETCATVGSAARFVVYAGGQDKLIAVTEKDASNSPTMPYTQVYADLFATLPTTSNGNHLMETSVDAEALLALHPDVIISSRSAAECDALQESTGIPVVGISYQDQIFANDVYDSILVVGNTLDTSAHAEQVVHAMQDWAADLDARTSNIPETERPTAYVGGVNYKGAKSFGGTYTAYAPFEAGNIHNVADELGGLGSVDVSIEQIGAWNPDVMFLNTSNLELLQKDYDSAPEFFAQITAFQTGALYSQPAFNFNGTNVEVGICEAYFCAAMVYPSAFDDVDLEERYDEIFTTMLGSAYYDTMQQNGMSFERINLS